jgi:pimeloyl-ACP methyl ester carboxylesterase
MIRQSFEQGMFIRKIDGSAGNQHLVYIHGLGESALCFEDIVLHPLLSKWSQIAPDLPGYGKSYYSRSPMTLMQTADHLAKWLNDSHIEPIVLIGHSMGGVIGQCFAEKYPEMLSGFINVDGNISMSDCSFSGKAAAQPEEIFLSAGFDTLKDKIYRHGLGDESMRGYYVSLRLADARQFYRNSIDLVEFSKPETAARRMAELKMPKLYVGGVPGGVSARSQELLASEHVPLKLLSPSGHWPFIDQADEFAQALADWLIENA